MASVPAAFSKEVRLCRNKHDKKQLNFPNYSPQTISALVLAQKSNERLFRRVLNHNKSCYFFFQGTEHTQAIKQGFLDNRFTTPSFR